MSDKPKKAEDEKKETPKRKKYIPSKNSGLLGKAARALRDRESSIDARMAEMEGAQTTDSNN